MKINFKAKDLELNEDIKNLVEKKLETLQRFFQGADPEAVLAEVELSRTTLHHQSARDLFRAEINLTIAGRMFRAESEQSDLRTALEEVRDDLEREINKFKTKKETVFIRGARSIKKAISLSPLARFNRKSKNQEDGAR